MSRFFCAPKMLVTSAMLLVLAGCSASGVNNVAIEDRSVRGSTPSRVIEQNTEVEVMAFDVRPSFKTTTNPSAIQNTEASSQEKAQEVATQAQMPAAVALLNTAEYQSSNGRLNAAQASLERALRISPKDPEVYRSLGEVHRRLGEYVQAEQMLLKGIAVAAGQSSKLRALWSALAKVRSESGDALGANKAFQKSQSY